MRKNLIKFFVVFVICSETRYRIGLNSANALTDQQRKEVELLRAQIDDALEKDDEKSLKAKGIIVQPEWTQHGDQPHSTKTKVVVTKTGLDEAKALRDEIKEAILHDHYAIGGTSGHDVEELHKSFVGNANNRKSKLGDILSSSSAQNAPNLIEINSNSDQPDIDIRKLQRLELTKRRTRETLILELIEEDFSFDLGKNVQEWEHIVHGGEEFFIGRLEQDLQIVYKNALRYEASEIVHIGAPISYLETYTFWNPEQQQREGIIIVATGTKVLWYRADKNESAITMYWDWVVGSTISGLTHFKADNMDYLVVSSNQSLRAGYYALNIYQYDLKNKEFWITQRLQLAHPCNEVTFLNTGRDYILAIPQNDTAMIYTFNPHTESGSHVHFQLKHEFHSEGIEYITAFQMGGRSYLALGGMQPKILLYQQGEFQAKTIFGNNFGLVEFFFPIPVRTYRDDLILLVQHCVDFSTHKLTVLETLIWNGEAFEATIPAPCKLGSHIFHGVNCMLDIQRNAGLKGATLLKRGDEVSVIVPRHEAESGLFRLHTKLLEKNSELKDLQEIFDFLKKWVAEQDVLIAEAQSLLNQPSTGGIFPPPDFNKLKLLETPELFFTGTFDELYVNDYKWTEGDSAMDLNRLLDEIALLERELSISRNKREADELLGHTGSFEQLDFDDVEAEFLEIEQLNGGTFYVQNSQLHFDGLLNLAELDVLETENISEGHQTILKELALDKDIEFDFINGIPWHDIADNLVFTNRPLNLDQLEIEGDIIVENRLEINELNSLKFPEEYLWTEGTQNPIINSKKTFIGTLSANHVDTEGFINDKDPLDIITLSDAQNWTGTPTFSQLEVSEILELNGTARGRGVEDYPENPSLDETNYINANCEFANLKVIGPIIIEEGKFNNEPLDLMLADVIQRPEDPNEEIQIPSKKTFSNVVFPLDFDIKDNEINNIPIDHFIPSHSFQELNLTLIDGYVYFGNLSITGSYDGVLIDELMRNAIRIDMPQNLSNTQLNFVGPVVADTINVVKTLNGVPIDKGYQTIEEDLVTPTAVFKTLLTDECDVIGDIGGSGNFNGIELGNLLEGNNAAGTRDIYVNELILSEGLQVDKIHGLHTELLYKFLDSIDSLAEMILDGKVHVDRVTVSGNVQVNKLNGQDFDNDIQLMAIRLDRPNFLSTKLRFTDEVHLNGPLNVLGSYNNENLLELIDDMVFRNLNGTVLILAPKKFNGYVRVLGNTQVDALNGIPFDEFANKRNPTAFKGSLLVNGNLIVQDLIVDGTLNDFPVSEISNRVRYDSISGAFILRGMTNFSAPLELNDLTVLGDLNEYKNLGNFFENLVYKRGSCVLNGQYNFTGRVSIEHGAYIGYLNGHNLMDLFNDIVYIDSLEPVFIESPIHFKSPVKMSVLSVKGPMQTNNLSGCSIKVWLDDTLNVGGTEIITKPLRFEYGSLNGNSIFASFLNDIDLSKIISLNSSQNLTDGLRFSSVILDGSIEVRGSVNGIDLKAEYENTMLTKGNQHIRTPLTIHKVNVLQNLRTIGNINGDKNLENVALLHENAEFESPMYFEELRTQNLIANDLISGIDFNDWYKFTLWKEGRKEHRITGNWTIESFGVENGPPYEIGEVRVMNGEQSFQELCRELKQLSAKYSKRSYSLKHLSESFELNLNSSGIYKVFKLNGDNLLINSGCNSTIFQWNANEKKFYLRTNFESGVIEQIAEAEHNGQIKKFMTNSYLKIRKNCTYVGQNLWELNNDSIRHLKNFTEEYIEIWSAAGFKGFIFAITTDGGLKKIATTAPYAIQTLDTNATFESKISNFLDRNLNLKILNYNSSQYSRDPDLKQRQKREIRTNHDNISIYPRSTHALAVEEDSMLKPNETIVRKLTFSEFSTIIERILEDLAFRLGIEINYTHSSIPESELVDMHLVEDFLAIIDELRTQKIYPPETFHQINLESIQIPENSAQVLAAHTVQIVWPVIVEIDEIHRYLRGHSGKEHPICACILNYLGLVIKDVLEIAYRPMEMEKFEFTAAFKTVLSRVRQFQDDLKTLETELKLEIVEDLSAEIERESSQKHERVIEEIRNSYNSSDEKETIKKIYTNERSELLNIEVGAELSPFNVFAVAHAKSRRAPEAQPGGINLYTDVLANDLFQFIPAYKPRSLTTLRLRDITLLAYIEYCCTVNILQYRGVEGFVQFAKFTLKTPVSQIIAISLPHADYGKRHYLALVLQHKLVFYEAVFVGLREVPAAEQLDCSENF